MFFLKPIRCRDCKERFWVRNRNAYISAASLLAFSALLITTVWLVIEQNMNDSFTEASKGEPGRPPTNTANAATSANNGKLIASAGENRSSVNAGVKSPNPPQTVSQSSQAARKAKDDHQFTVQLYQDSAENGEADAQYKLGLLYLTGNGALQDFAEAAKWLKRAAEQGYALAQYELGLIYRMGHGFDVDPVKSYMWLNLASAAGIQQAVGARDEVMRSLSPKQLAQAQKISREWLASRTRGGIASKTPGKVQPETDLEALEYAGP